HDEDGPRRPGQVLGWKPVYAAREVAAVVLPDGRALVLDEGRLDLAVVQQQPRREVTGELLARPLEIDPEHQTGLPFPPPIPLVLGLERLVLDRRVAGRQRQPVEGCHDFHALARSLHDAPLSAERLVDHAALADDERLLLLALAERERRGDRRDVRGCQRNGENDGGAGRSHGAGPTTTRLKACGGKY